MARVLGTLCMLLAAVVLGLGVWGYLDVRDGTTSITSSEVTNAPDVTEVTDGLAIFLLISSFTSALVLATIGATAVLAGNAVDRLKRDRYQPRYTPPPVAPTVTPQWHPGPAPAPPPAAAMPPRPGLAWGPPAGDPAPAAPGDVQWKPPAGSPRHGPEGEPTPPPDPARPPTDPR